MPSASPEPLRSSLLAADPDMRDLVAEFVGELPTRIESARQALEAADWTLLKRIAHQLKGAGGSYGYPDITRLAAAMEASCTSPDDQQFREWLRQLEELTAAARIGLRV
ncbi:MAG: Hpt domain-containing protein [Phycisphaerae bacterium]|jgi:HPt (histidine-containing phosphotransfer) domain-containing protein